MSYDLDVLRGDIDDAEEVRPPLDLAVAEEAMSGSVAEGGEYYLDLGAVVATFLLVRPDGVLRTIGVTVTSDGTASRDDLRDAYRRLVATLFPLAERLGARIYDHQAGDWLDPARPDEAVAAYA